MKIGLGCFSTYAIWYVFNSKDDYIEKLYEYEKIHYIYVPLLVRSINVLILYTFFALIYGLISAIDSAFSKIPWRDVPHDCVKEM